MFYWSKKKCSGGVSSADLRSSEETPLCGVIVPLYLHTREYCKCFKYFWGVSMEKFSHALFLQLLRNISRSHTIVKRFDPGCARAVLLAAACLSPPHYYRVMPFISSALVQLNEPSYKPQKLELAWVGNGLRFGFLLLLKQAEL